MTIKTFYNLKPIAACLAAIVFTGCPDAADIFKSFGKDDLYGTWMTLEFDENGNRQDYYINTTNSDPYVITWKFDGKAENMFNGNGGSFWQHLIHYDDVTDNGNGTYTFGNKVKETFWYGEYAIKGNSGYSKGKLYLYYECGYDLPLNGSGVSLETLKTWKVNDYLSYAGLTGLNDEKLSDESTDSHRHTDDNGVKYYLDNNVTIQIREVNGQKQCSDIEYFRFNLKDGAASGYTRLMATIKDKNGSGNIGGIYSQWVSSGLSDQTYNGGYKVHNGNSWTGQSTRYMGRISVNSTPQNPRWLYSRTETNDQLFHLNDTANDFTDYETPDAEVNARAEE